LTLKIALWVTLQATNLHNPNIYRIFAAIKTPKIAAYEQEKVPKLRIRKDKEKRSKKRRSIIQMYGMWSSVPGRYQSHHRRVMGGIYE
jgi:hypothetical protein